MSADRLGETGSSHLLRPRFQSAEPHATAHPDVRFRERQVTARTSLAGSVDGSLGIALLLLIAVVALFELTPLDLMVQDRLFDFDAREWVVDDDWVFVRLVFHELPTVIAVTIGLALLHLLFAPNRWQRVLRRKIPRRRSVACALLTVITVPAVVNVSKATTNVFCPYEVDRYGGDVCYARLFEPQPEAATSERRGRCFPGGHASGPFALVGLFGLVQSRRAKLMAIGFAALFGWVAGSYQMLTGAHYLSHTIVSMIVAWIGFLLWRRLLRLHEIEN